MFHFIGKLIFHLVIFQVNHLLCESGLCVIYLLQPLYRKDWETKERLLILSWKQSQLFNFHLYLASRK